MSAVQSRAPAFPGGLEWFNVDGGAIDEAHWPSIQAVGLLLSRPDDVVATHDRSPAVTRHCAARCSLPLLPSRTSTDGRYPAPTSASTR